ncbi:MAG: hypothetical protein QOJ65_2568 [Fimbriimonadaceae bacterium]|jgi:hypothetical protein|nr:hypothetical protein [Fimbriimonadaceae bacterium]
MARSRLLLPSLAIVLGSLAFAAYRAGGQLYLNGALASSSVIEVKGTAYVPVKDVAKALNMTISKSGRGIELSPAGGANMVQGLEGKVGDELFNGFARFKVLEVIRGKKYTNRFSGDNQEITPYPENQDLVVVVCRIKNASKEMLPVGLPAGNLTGLTDMDEHTVTPMNGVSTDIPTRGANLLPGSAVDFALTFQVPEKAVLKDLVYEVYDLGGSRKAEPFRVSLKS